ncbi:hypothetical protein L226DRAFT_49290 [Lentinus tigrinus ALCF2SS1-7]|uniref:uncharacterized protein n=1 Tax=Lentinus tigrinus ALCF2SS1-7 TaxID=1328758 RepID=UPI00116637AA|nr:hypothetical protein L226DRAFT_49290 [Lentinus tigrinus ALCF2SS1-7]
MDFASDDSDPFAATPASTVISDDIQDDIDQFLDTMSRPERTYTGDQHELASFPFYVRHSAAFSSLSYGPVMQPAILPEPSTSTQSMPPIYYGSSTPRSMAPTYHVSASDAASDASSPQSDATLVASPPMSHWDSRVQEPYEEASTLRSATQRSYGNTVESPVDPHALIPRVYGYQASHVGVTSPTDSFTKPEYAASAFASGRRDIRDGNGELQHDGGPGLAAALYDETHRSRDVGVDTDTSATASTSTVSPESSPDTTAPPQRRSTGSSRRRRAASQSSSKPYDSPPPLDRPYACAYEGCSFGEISCRSDVAMRDRCSTDVLHTVTDRTHNLRQHVENVHTGVRPHKCADCGQGFKREFDLKRHRISYHTTMVSPRRKDSEGKTATARKQT